MQHGQMTCPLIMSKRSLGSSHREHSRVIWVSISPVNSFNSVVFIVILVIVYQWLISADKPIETESGESVNRKDLPIPQSKRRFDRVSNLATLQTAPQFTAENAAEMARRGVEIRAKRKQDRINAEQALIAKPMVEPEVNRIVKAMSKLNVTSDDYARLAAILDRLWNKAFPTQGAVKSRSSRPIHPSVEPLPVSQPVSQSSVTPENNQ
jgi:hypothetical protein